MNPFLVRAIIMFLVLLLPVTTSTVLMVKEGIRSGELHQNVIDPIRKIVKDGLASQQNQTPDYYRITESSPSSQTITTVTSQNGTSVNMTVNTGGRYESNQVRIIVNPGQTMTNITGSSVSIDEVAKQNQAWVDAQNAAAKAQMDAFRAKSNVDMLQFSAQAQQGMTDFQKQAEESRKAFLEKNGITP